VKTTVLIVDDHAEFRVAARAMLENDGFTVVGEAVDGPGALLAAIRLRPALVLLDIRLPVSDGFSVADQLAALEPAPAVVLISTRGIATYRERLKRAPVRGFVAKADLSGAALTGLLGG
jgi:DNA-binding NarL/FixJ family response regulator